VVQEVGGSRPLFHPLKPFERGAFFMGSTHCSSKKWNFLTDRFIF
jgi:hypothetical protein